MGWILARSGASNAVLPANGVVFENAATITFSANLVNTAVNLPPLYDGETAFSNGAIILARILVQVETLTHLTVGLHMYLGSH